MTASTMRERKTKSSSITQQSQQQNDRRIEPSERVNGHGNHKTRRRPKSMPRNSNHHYGWFATELQHHLPNALRKRRELTSLLALFSCLVCLTWLIRSYDTHADPNSSTLGLAASHWRRLSLRPEDEAHAPTHQLLQPPSKVSWPFTLKDHPEQFETIVHPGDNQTQMAVPTFWSPPLHQGQLMTREYAMQMGVCAQAAPDTTDTSFSWWQPRRQRLQRQKNPFLRGDACPPEHRTIFVAIASYRDFQCRETVEDIFRRATHPHRVRVGVVDQIVDGLDVACDTPLTGTCDDDNKNSTTSQQSLLCRYRNQIDVLEVEAPLSLGPTFARHLGHRMYRGEYFCMQTDAHVSFVQGWDTDIISQLTSTNNEMAVLSTYLSDIRGSLTKEGRSLRDDTRPIMCNSAFVFEDEEDDSSDEMAKTPPYIRHTTQPDSEPKIEGMPQLEPWWAAGFSFSRGHFVVNVPYDAYQPMIFQGEELSISLRGFTVGYDYYAPERSVCFHHYARTDRKIKYFGENEKNAWYTDGLYVNAMRRLLGIVHMLPAKKKADGVDKEKEPPQQDLDWDHREVERYGLGKVRTPAQFYDLFGIDVVHHRNEGHLCRFVDAVKPSETMHAQFTPFLRDDGMGIDYDKITFRFKDPAPSENDDDDDGTDDSETSEEEPDKEERRDEEQEDVESSEEGRRNEEEDAESSEEDRSNDSQDGSDEEGRVEKFRPESKEDDEYSGDEEAEEEY